MFNILKNKNSSRTPQKIDNRNRQFYSYSSSNRYNNRDMLSRRDRANIVSSSNDNENKITLVEKTSNYLILLLIIICSFYITTLSSDARIILNQNNPLLLSRDSSKYNKSFKELFNKSLINKNKLTIKTSVLSEELKNMYPEISKVNIRLPLVGRRPIVDITTDEIVFVLNSNNKYYGIGKSGKILVESNEKLDVGKKVPIIKDDSKIENKIGYSIMTKTDVDFILNTIEQFNIKNIAIEYIILPNVAAEIHVKPIGLPYYIKFSLLTDYRVAVGQYLALKKKIESENIIPAEYVDSRVEERIYYK